MTVYFIYSTVQIVYVIYIQNCMYMLYTYSTVWASTTYTTVDVYIIYTLHILLQHIFVIPYKSDLFKVT